MSPPSSADERYSPASIVCAQLSYLRRSIAHVPFGFAVSVAKSRALRGGLRLRAVVMSVS